MPRESQIFLAVRVRMRRSLARGLQSRWRRGFPCAKRGGGRTVRCLRAVAAMSAERGGGGGGGCVASQEKRGLVGKAAAERPPESPRGGDCDSGAAAAAGGNRGRAREGRRIASPSPPGFHSYLFLSAITSRPPLLGGRYTSEVYILCRLIPRGYAPHTRTGGGRAGA